VQTFANWKFYAKWAIEGEEVWFRGGREKDWINWVCTAVVVRGTVQ